MGSRASLIILALLPSGSLAAGFPPGPCHDACEQLVKDGCPAQHCAGVIYGGTCHAFCSGTYEASPTVQFYIDGRIIDLEPKSAPPSH